jgi:hypothetical protein
MGINSKNSFRTKKDRLAVELIKPFEINKAGLGMMAAWLKTENIDRIKK